MLYTPVVGLSWVKVSSPGRGIFLKTSSFMNLNHFHVAANVSLPLRIVDFAKKFKAVIVTFNYSRQLMVKMLRL